MSKALEFSIVITENGNTVLTKPLSFEFVASIISNFDDNITNSDIFGLAAHHLASGVRENVAYKDAITEDTIQILAQDGAINVLRNLVRTSKFKELATLEQLERLMQRDPEIAISIAGDIDSYSNVDTTKLVDEILKNSDPSVTAALAGGYNTPKKILKSLLSHPDPYVVSQAKFRLDN